MSGTATTTLLDAALDYRQMWGAPVVPVNDHKQPLCEWGQWRYGGQTESAVKELFSRPAHGLALLLWPASTLAVMDFDGPHAEQAWRSTGVSVPRTARVYTPHGVHDYFRMPPSVECDEVDRKVRIVTARECGCVKPCGVDLLVKGYALAPPTPRYREDPDYVLEPSRIADLPEGVLALMRHATATGNGERFTIAERIPEGERNTELYKLARSLKARNMSPDAILAALLKENEMKCEPLLPDAEIEKIVAHAYEQPDRPEFAATGGADRQESAAGGAEREKPNDAVIIRLADVQPEPVTWLWPGRVPLGKLTVLDGDPGLGKSTLAFDLAARVSNGSLMPDGSPSLPGGAVILTLEDGLADTVVPRLTVAGADLAKIVALQGVKGADGKLRVPTVEDIAALTCACQQVAAKIVLIDPLMAYLPSQRNSWRDQDVRQALAPLAKMAEENGVAVLVIRHLNKSGGSQSIYRGGGSIGIVGAARMALLVAKDPENEERRILAGIKTNLARMPESLAFRVVAIDDTARIVWEGVSSHSADALLAAPVSEEERSAMEDAADFLRSILKKGPVEVRQIQRVAREAGIAEKTLQRAKHYAGATSKRDTFGEGGKWFWSLDGQKASKVVIQNDDHLRHEMTILAGEEVCVL